VTIWMFEGGGIEGTSVKEKGVRVLWSNGGAWGVGGMVVRGVLVTWWCVRCCEE
jgi:hypothetical protein